MDSSASNSSSSSLELTMYSSNAACNASNSACFSSNVAIFARVQLRVNLTIANSSRRELSVAQKHKPSSAKLQCSGSTLQPILAVSVVRCGLDVGRRVIVAENLAGSPSTELSPIPSPPYPPPLLSSPRFDSYDDAQNIRTSSAEHLRSTSTGQLRATANHSVYC